MVNGMKVSLLKEGMLLAVSVSDSRPIVRSKEPDRLAFIPDILAYAGFGGIRPLNHKSYYFYLGTKREIVPEQYTKNGNPKTKSYHQVMDQDGFVYKVHGREFKNFEPVWEEKENENSNN